MKMKVKIKIKTIDLTIFTFCDVYGSIYSSAKVVVNYGLKGGKSIYLPIQYGGPSRIRYVVVKALSKLDFPPSLRDWCEERGIIYREFARPAKKRELKALSMGQPVDCA